MRSASGSIIFLLVLLLVNWYVFQALKTVSVNWTGRTRIIVYSIYWLICGLGFALMASLPYIQFDTWPKAVRTYLFAIPVGFFLAQLVSIPFFLMDDIRRLFQWGAGFFVAKKAAGIEAGEGISRSVFLSWLGLGIGGGLFGSLLYGFKNKYNYQVRKIQLAYPNLPKAFKGFKLVHISDIHSGSFTDKEAVLRGVQLINEQAADVVLFTGDMVNDRATEMEPFMDVFSRVQAKQGVYSTFGNHDYGDYVRWKTDEEKLANQAALRKVHAELGWRLLWDEHVVLQKEDAQIGLIGVQNISGKGNFHSYGSLAKALHNKPDTSFNILMSHDPSHWDAEVVKDHPNIDLTLSGHTHGMQFGVEIPGFRWSPVKWMYKQWAGLYETGTQKLYVNRGFGFIGYPGRVGILPEITVIELV
ncbi:MAG: metallophosphoesterase [Bacteroidetes bacterium]|uniref:metallophosphoesterase n=1 Tax=Phnomibacter sp. TaxID=2836217 RepID=UPI002FDD2EF8|nr:metallophosphoesterase [Bacteroidota bacterium]